MSGERAFVLIPLRYNKTRARDILALYLTYRIHRYYVIPKTRSARNVYDNKQTKNKNKTFPRALKILRVRDIVNE